MLVRPAVEAGERLGFLPGDIGQKVDPYLRPLYDALYEMLGFETVNKYIERNIIEVAPLAFMRGRTLNNAFIILDEAQNTTREQMKMFLTRIGFGSRAVITGDITQTDLPSGKVSGLNEAIAILGGVLFGFGLGIEIGALAQVGLAALLLSVAALVSKLIGGWWIGARQGHSIAVRVNLGLTISPRGEFSILVPRIPQNQGSHRCAYSQGLTTA